MLVGSVVRGSWVGSGRGRLVGEPCDRGGRMRLAAERGRGRVVKGCGSWDTSCIRTYRWVFLTVTRPRGRRRILGARQRNCWTIHSFHVGHLLLDKGFCYPSQNWPNVGRESWVISLFLVGFDDLRL